MLYLLRLFGLLTYVLASVSIAAKVNEPYFVDSINIGVLSVRPYTEESIRWEPLATYLKGYFDKNTKINVHVYDFKDMDTAIKARELDFIITNPSDYVYYAHKIGLSAPIASLVDESSVTKHQLLYGFGGTIVVRADNKQVNSLADLVGKRIAITDTNSLGGYQAQALELFNIGINLTRQAELIITDLPHDKALQALLAGHADVAFIRSGILEALEQAGNLPAGTLKVINQRDLPDYPYKLSTRLYPERPVAVMPHVPEALAEHITALLLELPKDSATTQAMGIHGFTLPYNYESVENLLQTLRLPPYENQPPIRFQEIWRDHWQVIILLGFSLIFAFIMLFLVILYVFRLKKARRKITIQANYLETEQAQLKTLLRTLPDMVWLKDTQGVFHFCNQGFERLFGTTEANIIGKTDYDFITLELANAFGERDTTVIESALPTINEEWLSYHDGSYTGLFLTTKTPVKDNHGKVIGVLGVARDITDIRKTEIALNERIKEQRCLNQVLRITEVTESELDNIFRRVVEVLPPGWLYPERLAAQIEWQGQQFRTHNFQETIADYQLSVPILLDHLMQGSITVVYTVPCPEQDEGPFLKEERALLEAIAERLGSSIKRRNEIKISRSREQIFRTIVSQAPDAITLIDLENLTFVEFNDAACNGLGYSRDEFSKIRLPDIQNPLDSELEITKALENQAFGSVNFDTLRRKKNGTLCHVNVSVKIITLQERNYLSLIWTDITERKYLESKMQQYQDIVNSSEDAIISKSLEGFVLSWNHGAETIFGYRSEEMIGKSMKLLLPDGNQDEEDLILEKIIKGQTVEHFETKRIRKDNTVIFISATISPIRNNSGQIIGASKIARDITDKKRIEEELENYHNHLETLVQTRTQELENAKQEAENANQSKSIFLADMSHEIRTPMNAVIGFAYLLQNEIEQPTQKDKLDKIIKSGKHLLGIINDVLDLSKIEADHLILENSHFEVHTIINHVNSMMTDRINSKGLKLIEDIDPRLTHLTLIGDTFRLSQIIINLVSNAVKFTDSGRIEVRAKLVDEQSQQVKLRFEVKDTGIGISEAQQKKLFEAFSQAESSTTRKYGGTGLGLVICKKLVLLMNGEIGINSELGKGSTFWFTVRLSRSFSEVSYSYANTINERKSLRKNAHILLVEDNEINQEVAKQILNNFDLKVDIANHGAEALEYFQKNNYDLILMDMQMPVMNGLEATRKIRRLPKGENIPILAMTANAFEEDRQHCEQAGMNDFVSKPVDPERLRSILARWLPEQKNNSADIQHKTEEFKLINLHKNAILTQCIDTQAGLKFVGGKMSSYQHLLTKFAEAHTSDADNLETLIAQNEYAAAERLVHSLKSIAASLGMHNLNIIAEKLALQFRLASNQTISKINLQDIKVLKQALIDVQHAIKHILPEINSTEVEPIDQLKISQDIDKFRTLLEKDDMNAYFMWQNLAATFKKLIPEERVLLLARQIEAFEFPAALNNLSAIINDHPFLTNSQNSKP